MVKQVKFWKAGLILSTALAFCLAAALPSNAMSLSQLAQSYLTLYGANGPVVYYQSTAVPSPSASTTTSSHSTGSSSTGGNASSPTGNNGSSSTGSSGSSTSLPSLSNIWSGYSSSYGLNADEQQLLSLVNQQRVANHLPAFTVNLKLSYLARLRAQDMADHQDLTHYMPIYGTPPQMEEAAGIYANPMGAENICEGPSVTVDNSALFNSPPHRANLLDQQETQIGLGVVKSSNGIVWVSELFLGS